MVVLGLAALVLFGFAAVGTLAARGRIDSIEDFVSARDTAGHGTLTATVVASSMGAWILFSPAEAGAAFGGLPAIVGYAVGSALPLLVYTRLGPRIRRLIPEGHSLTEYAYARYGAAMYAYVLLVSVAYMFVFLAAEFTGIASALALVAGVPGWQTAALVGGSVLIYTIYGGLRASLLTDTIQALLILPLLVVAVVATLLTLGGTGQVHQTITAVNQPLLAPGYLPGIKFGVFVAIAVLGASLVNQAWWQRIYAARDDATLQRSFGLGAIAVIPMLLLAGLFGPLAVGLGLVSKPTDASISFFLVVQEVMPEWAVVGVALLAVLLVMSTADTLFNAIASVVTADLPRLLDVEGDTLTTAARMLTAVVAIAATFVGAQGYSVLTLFLLADLLAAATFIPLLSGLYSTRVWSGGALAGCLLGLLAGLVFFPPARSVLPALGLPAASYLWAFVSAAGTSLVVVTGTALLTENTYDLGRLAREIQRLDDAVATDGGTEPNGGNQRGDDE